MFYQQLKGRLALKGVTDFLDKVIFDKSHTLITEYFFSLQLQFHLQSNESFLSNECNLCGVCQKGLVIRRIFQLI